MPVSRISLLVNDIKDRYTRENFKRILFYLQNDLITQVPFYEIFPTRGIALGELGYNESNGDLKIYTTSGWVKISGGGGGGTSEEYVRDKYSVRFSEAIDVETVEEALDTIFQFTSQSCVTALVLSVPGPREKGDTLASVTLTASNALGTNPAGSFTSLLFKRGAATIDTVLLPGAVENYNETTPITNTQAFSAELTDSEGRSSTSVKTITFLYPILHLAGAASLTPAQIYSGATKILSSNISRSIQFITSTEVPYYCYPASLGLLTSILDKSGFEVFPDWSLRVESITGLDGSPQVHNIYTFNNLTTQDMTYTFIQ